MLIIKLLEQCSREEQKQALDWLQSYIEEVSKPSTKTFTLVEDSGASPYRAIKSIQEVFGLSLDEAKLIFDSKKFTRFEWSEDLPFRVLRKELKAAGYRLVKKA